MQPDTALYEKRFRDHWRRFQAQFKLPGDRQLFVYNDVLQHYAEPHRRYHGLKHPVLLLDELEIARKNVPKWFENPDQNLMIELAIWDHDYIYDPKKKDNEELSAEQVMWHAHHLGLSPVLGVQTAQIILATRHIKMPEGLPAQIVVDLDLSLLGASWQIFAEHSAEIREEYAHVSDEDWRAGRRAFLETMLRRSRIYSTGYFYRRFEAMAQTNLARSYRESFAH